MLPESLTADALAPLREYYDRCGVLALGPGLGRSDGTAALTAALIRKFPERSSLDADALWAVSFVPDILREAKSEIVITPHEGEFLRLGGSLENGRERGAWEFARRYGCITVLKIATARSSRTPPGGCTSLRRAIPAWRKAAAATC